MMNKEQLILDMLDTILVDFGTLFYCYFGSCENYVFMLERSQKISAFLKYIFDDCVVET